MSTIASAANPEPVVDEMTADDIETWRMLTREKTGKKQKKEGTGYPRRSGTQMIVSWDAEDTRQLVAMVNTAIEQKASPKAIRKFLNLFGTTAREALAGHPDLDVHALPVLTKDTSAKVREAVARRNTVPVPIMNVLATDKSCDVRLALIFQPDLPEKTVNLMYEHLNDKMVSRKDNANWLTREILSHPKLSASHRQQALYLSSASTHVSWILENPHITSEEIAHKWRLMRENGNESVPYYMHALVSHAKTPVSVLEEYVEESIAGKFSYPYSFQSLKPLFRNNGLPANTIAKIFNYKTAHPEQSDHSDVLVWEGISAHPNTSDSQLEWIINEFPGPAASNARAQLRDRKGHKDE